MRRYQKSPCGCSIFLIESMPAGCRMDLLLAEVEPISDGCSASRTTWLRRGTKVLLNDSCSGKDERGYVRETALQASRSVQKEGQEVLQAQKQRFP